MPKGAARNVARPAKARRGTQAAPPKPGLIHPVVIYPFHHPKDFDDLKKLYELIARLGSQPDSYARPITVVDRKTHAAMEQNQPYLDFRRNTVAVHSDILDAWCVDTCQMWYSGLGLACDRGGEDDVYWLIPGDFDYGSPVGREVLAQLHDLPEICAELGQDLCIGEVSADHNNPKQLIDTYGTFALLYNWFPSEAREIREYTQRPRSEFFAIRHAFLREMLHQRWYAYEQTVVLLLHAVLGQKRISRFFVGHITDLPEGRESFASIIQQIERTERVLKSLWRARNEPQPDWNQRYRELESRSEEIRRAAYHIIESLLS